MPFLDDMTVAIPLYRGKDWEDVVFSNINELAGICRIMISDCTEEDSLFQEIMETYSSVATIQFLGRRSIQPGWIAHWSDLLSRSQTEFFMWLPQDDEIGADWIVRNRDSLLENIDLAGAFGIIHRVNRDGSTEPFGVKMPIRIKPRNVQALDLLGRWNLGIAMRSVWRTSKVLPMLETQPPNGEWGDLVWIYGTLLQHKIAQNLDVIYRKRWHTGSAHDKWRPFIPIFALRFLVREMNRRNLSKLVYFNFFFVCLTASVKVLIKILVLKMLSYQKIRHFKS